ncbi:hypothetical protein AAFF_G00320390 [Aldrovandia affinis]|uniref:Uncharacterized protein n=1 Tax=Aldrovandia affinis TaxID=143900 RepID=A0AAD7VZN5_9TELE|nr:hypothetical protein AAFF_G00320390 [Aldrovandia affinis]
MVVPEVAKMEEEWYEIKTVSQGHQGGWTTWKGIVSRPMSWSDLWKIPQARLSFLIRATYDTLSCPRNLHQWFGNEECCPLCILPTQASDTSCQDARPCCPKGTIDGDMTRS